MKNIIFVLLFVFSSSFLLHAQNDGCMQFFPDKEGTVMISKSYDASNKLLSTMTYRINKVYNYSSGEEILIGFTMTDGNNKAIDQGTITARCDDGTFYLTMSNRALTPDVIKMLGSDTELVGDFLDYPDAFSDVYNGNLGMTGGTFTVQSKSDKKARISVRVYGREYQKTERITTPAGTFNAAKVTFNFESQSGKKTTHYRGTEWYAPNAGIVRTETHDNKGNLLSYTVLTTLTGN